VRRLGAINSMATAITSYALDTKQTFPFVTIPHFEIRGSDLRIQADAAIILWTPLVTDETRVAWEDYALEKPLSGRRELSGGCEAKGKAGRRVWPNKYY
jgi:hypothetical protein